MKPYLPGRDLSTERIRVFVVEDDPRLRQSLTEALQGFPQLEIAAMSGHHSQTLAEILRVKPRLVLIGLGRPRARGVDLTAQVKRQAPGMEVLIWTDAEDERCAHDVICAGASGYLTHRSGLERICFDIHQLTNGGTVLDPLIAKRFWSYFRMLHLSKTSPPKGGVGTAPWRLTGQEVGILTYLAKGLSNAEVGSLMALSRRSVRTRLAHIYRKMGVRSHVEAVAHAFKAGLVEV